MSEGFVVGFGVGVVAVFVGCAIGAAAVGVIDAASGCVIGAVWFGVDKFVVGAEVFLTFVPNCAGGFVLVIGVVISGVPTGELGASPRGAFAVVSMVESRVGTTSGAGETIGVETTSFDAACAGKPVYVSVDPRVKYHAKPPTATSRPALAAMTNHGECACFGLVGVLSTVGTLDTVSVTGSAVDAVAGRGIDAEGSVGVLSDAAISSPAGVCT